MTYRLAVTSNRNRAVALLALAIMIGIVLLAAFHHHEETSNDDHCLICLLLSSPVLHATSLIIILTAACAGMWRLGNRSVSVPKPIILIYSLRAPPVSF